jgi:ethanolamine utilization protein EutA (predicted chaperonin)
MTKKLERKVAELEEWIAQFEAGTDDKNVFDNLNFMISQCKNLGDRLQQVEKSHRQLDSALQHNAQIVNDFISEQELDETWQEYLAGLQEDADASKEGQEQEDN